MKGDDAFGPRIAQEIPGAINAKNVPENYISKIKKTKPGIVIIFDALDFGGKFGEIKIIEAGKAKGILLSTHAIPLSKFSEMLAPSRVWLVGVQPKSALFGEEMSREVSESARKIKDEVLCWLKSHS